MTVSIFYDGVWLDYEGLSPLQALCMMEDARSQGLPVKRNGVEIVAIEYKEA